MMSVIIKKTSKKNLKGPETGYYKPEESEKLAMLI